MKISQAISKFRSNIHHFFKFTSIIKNHLFVKKIILIESNSKEEYDKEISCLHKNKILNAVYAAARTLI